MHLGAFDIILIAVFILGIIFFIFYFLNKKVSTKFVEQESFIKQAKQTVSMFVIDKKRAKITDINMPKAVLASMPKFYKFIKLNFVQVKIGPQILNLICDKHIFNNITLKKTVKAEVAGLYIVSVVGIKSKQEIKALKKSKKNIAKDTNKKSK